MLFTPNIIYYLSKERIPQFVLRQLQFRRANHLPFCLRLNNHIQTIASQHFLLLTGPLVFTGPTCGAYNLNFFTIKIRDNLRREFNYYLTGAHKYAIDGMSGFVYFCENLLILCIVRKTALVLRETGSDENKENGRLDRERILREVEERKKIQF